jgi:carboxymethylenebutenolidase
VADRLPLHRILTERVDVEVDPGEPPMSAFLARPATPGPHAGVIVGHELFGVGGHVRDVAERLASLGHLALAPDLHHRTAPWVELPHDAAGRDAGFALLRRMTRDGVLADVAAALGDLHARGATSVGMLGLSMGGHVAYLAATELDLAAVVVAYGGWIPTTDIPISRPEPTIARTASITARMLVLVGSEDHAIDEDERAALAGALREAGIRHEVVEYPGVSHGFLCDRRDTYDAAVAGDAWARIEELFAAER